METTPPESAEVESHRSKGTAPWIIGGVIILIVICGFIVASPGHSPSLIWQNILKAASAPAATESNTKTDSFSPHAGARVFEGGVYVTYVYFTGDSFLPSEVTVGAGETVRFVNKSNLAMRVGSRPENLSSSYYALLAEAHPGGEGTSFDMTLTQPGIWAYEDLASTNPRIFGSVYVR